jgi:hypothetical protein
MPVLDAQGEELEAPYNVPTHLEASESIGPIPHRLWAVGLGAWVSSSMLLASAPAADELTRMALQWGPAVVLAPFAAWWLKPPPEHGLAAALRHLSWPRLLDPDRLDSYQRMRVEGGALYTGHGQACLTLWRLPQVNLDIASAASITGRSGAPSSTGSGTASQSSFVRGDCDGCKRCTRRSSTGAMRRRSWRSGCTSISAIAR